MKPQSKPYFCRNFKYYCGWYIMEFQHNGKPHFEASKFGVSINTNSEEGLYHMIDIRSEDKDAIVK